MGLVWASEVVTSLGQCPRKVTCCSSLPMWAKDRSFAAAAFAWRAGAESTLVTLPSLDPLSGAPVSFQQKTCHLCLLSSPFACLLTPLVTVCVQTPSILSWTAQDAAHNIFNTPNIFAIWGVEQITADLLQKGGLEAAGIRSARRAQQVGGWGVLGLRGFWGPSTWTIMPRSTTRCTCWRCVPADGKGSWGRGWSWRAGQLPVAACCAGSWPTQQQLTRQQEMNACWCSNAELSVHAGLQVYDALDGSEGFYSNRVDPTYRSHTAIPFR